MVTGLKIATGFCRSVECATQAHLHLRPRLIVGGAPNSEAIVLAAGGSQGLSHGRSANKVVFAYRVIRIRMKIDGEVSYRQLKGGKYGLSVEEEEDPWVVEELDEVDMERDFPNAVAVEVVAVGGHENRE